MKLAPREPESLMSRNLGAVGSPCPEAASVLRNRYAFQLDRATGLQGCVCRGHMEGDDGRLRFPVEQHPQYLRLHGQSLIKIPYREDGPVVVPVP